MGFGQPPAPIPPPVPISIAGPIAASSVGRWLTWVSCIVSFLGAEVSLRAQEAAFDSGSSFDRTDEAIPDMVRLVKEADFHAGCALDADCAMVGGGAKRQLELAIGKYEDAQRLGAGSAPFLNRLAEMYLAAGSGDKALTSLRRSLHEQPGQLPVHSRIGEVFLAAGRIDSAIHYVENARELSPQLPTIHSSLGFLYLQAGQQLQGKAHLDTSIALDDANAEGHRFLGYYYTQVDSLDVAIRHYVRLIELIPGDVEGHNNVGFLLTRQKRYTEAIEYYKKTKKLSTDPNLLHAVNLNIEAIRAIVSGKMRARYILVETETEGRRLTQRIEAGEDFAELATRFSKAPNARDGGDLGYFGPGDMLPAVEEAVLNLKVGEVSEVIRIQSGLMILQRLN